MVIEPIMSNDNMPIDAFCRVKNGVIVAALTDKNVNGKRVKAFITAIS